MDNFETVLRNVLFEFKAEIDKSISELKTELHELKTELHELKTELHELKTELQELKTELHEFKAEMYEFRTEMYKFKAETEKALLDINLRLDNHDKQLELLTNDVRRLNFRADTFRNRFTSIENDLKSVKQS